MGWIVKNQMVDIQTNCSCAVDPKEPKSDTAPSPLYTACQENADAIVFLLVSRGANVNLTHEGTSPLYIAVQQGNRKLVGALLNAGADVNLVGTLRPTRYKYIYNYIYLAACYY